jgi:hypothetical protein
VNFCIRGHPRDGGIAQIKNVKTESESSQPSQDRRRAEDRDNASPFSPTAGSLNPPTFNNAATAGSAQATLPAGPGSLLNQLNVPPPGGDALLQSFNKAVDNMVRATALFANSTTVVVQKTVKQAAPKNIPSKSFTQNAGNVAGDLSAKQGSQQASRTVNQQTQAATSTVHNLGSGIQGLIGPGGLGDGIGGLGSAAGTTGSGAGAGGMGGAMGTVGGAVGGLPGGH